MRVRVLASVHVYTCIRVRRHVGAWSGPVCLCMTTRVSRHSNVTRRRRPCIKRRTHSSPRSGTRRAWILQPRTSECAKPTCPGYPRRSRPPVRQVKGCRPTKHCENPTRHLQRSREALLRSCRSPGWGIRGRYSECTKHTALSTAAPGCQRPPLRSTTAQATKPACRARSRRRRSESTGHSALSTAATSLPGSRPRPSMLPAQHKTAFTHKQGVTWKQSCRTCLRRTRAGMTRALDGR